MSEQGYKTIEGRSIAEIVEKKSRFIAHLAHVTSEEEALVFLEFIRTEHAQARHNVYAYILRGETSEQTPRIRYSDDGEPAKTAGIPTLEALQHAELTNVCAVVTRYFGGTLLGTGGLVRAYTQATQEAIATAHIVTISQVVDVSLELPYAQYEQALKLATACGANVEDSQFAEQVSLTLRILDGKQQPLLDGLTELTRGQVPVETSEPLHAPI